MLLRLLSRSSYSISARNMSKRKAESLDTAPKKSKESVKGVLDRSPTPRINGIVGSQMKIISANVAGLRGLLNNEDKKSNFMALIKAESPDVIALQEHKLQEMHVDSEGSNIKKLLPNYKQYWTCSTQKKGYSGVAVFVRTNEN